MKKITQLLDNWIQNKWAIALILAVVSFSTLFFLSGDRYFTDHDDARFAEIGREIAVSPHFKDWIIQKLNGEIYTQKPPLLPILIALSYKICGTVDEFSALLPSACMALFTLLICFYFWQRFFGKSVAFLSVLILTTNYIFVNQARSAQVDMVLLFFITLSLLSAYAYFEENRSKWIFLFFFATAGATLTKGPVGLILPSLIVFIYMLLGKKWKMLSVKPLLGGILLYLVIIGGWIGYLFYQAPANYMYELFIRQNITRYVDAFDHKKGLFYYFIYFLKDFFPWVLFVPFLFFSKSWKKNAEGKSLSFFWIWFFTVFIFFSLSESKRSLYLLPLYPAVSLLLGNGWFNQAKTKLLLFFSIVLIFTATTPFLFYHYFAAKESKAPMKKISLLQETIGTSPIRTFQSMEPYFLFYLQRIIPELYSLEEAEDFLSSKEKVFLLVPQKADASVIRQLKERYKIELELQFKKSVYLLFTNQ